MAMYSRVHIHADVLRGQARSLGSYSNDTALSRSSTVRYTGFIQRNERNSPLE